MELNFNSNAKKNRTQSEYDRCLKLIADNLSNGVECTELYVDLEVSSEVRNMLEAEFEKQGKKDNFDFVIVDRRPNQYTGRMQYFSGMTVGDKRYYKVRYTE